MEKPISGNKRNLSGKDENEQLQKRRASKDETFFDAESNNAGLSLSAKRPETHEVSELEKAITTAIEARFEHLERQLLKTIDGRFDRIEARIFENERKLDHLQERLTQAESALGDSIQHANHLRQQIQQLHSEIDEKEQYSRRDNIRIVGLPEKKGEKIEECEKTVQDFLKKELEIDTPISISIAHRLGKPKEGYNRAIICRLVKRSDKSVILGRRKKLHQKKTSIFISEDLTAANQRLLRDLKHSDRVERAWTFNCSVNVQGVNGHRLFGVKSVAQVEELLDRYNRR